MLIHPSGRAVNLGKKTKKLGALLHLLPFKDLISIEVTLDHEEFKCKPAYLSETEGLTLDQLATNLATHLEKGKT